MMPCGSLLVRVLVLLPLLLVVANAADYALLAGQEPCPDGSGPCLFSSYYSCMSASYYRNVTQAPPYAQNDVFNKSQLVAMPFFVPTNYTFQVSGLAAKWGRYMSQTTVNTTRFNLSVTFYEPNSTNPSLPGKALDGWDGGRAILFTVTKLLVNDNPLGTYRIEASLEQAFNLSGGNYFFQLAFWGASGVNVAGGNTIQNYADSGNSSLNYPYYTGLIVPPHTGGDIFPGSSAPTTYTWQRDPAVTGGLLPCLWPTGTLFAPQSNNSGGGDNGGGDNGGGDNGGGDNGGGDNGGGDNGGGSTGDATNPGNFVVQFTLLGSLKTWDTQPFVSTMRTLLNSTDATSGKRQSSSNITVVLSTIKAVQATVSKVDATSDNQVETTTEQSGVTVEFFISGSNGVELMERALRIKPSDLLAVWPNATLVGTPVAVGATSSDLSAAGQLGGASLQLVSLAAQWLLALVA